MSNTPVQPAPIPIPPTPAEIHQTEERAQDWLEQHEDVPQLLSRKNLSLGKITALLFLVVTLPLVVFVVSQQQQLAETRSQAVFKCDDWADVDSDHTNQQDGCKYKCTTSGWSRISCPGGGETGGGGSQGGGEANVCNSCGGLGQGICNSEDTKHCDAGGDGCYGNLVPVGGACREPGGQGMCTSDADCGTCRRCSGGSCVDIGGCYEGGSGGPPIETDQYDYITFRCTRCGTDRRCQSGDIGVNPQFIAGYEPGPCAQVDRRPKGSAGNWEVVSLCDSSCSGEPPPAVGGPLEQPPLLSPSPSPLPPPGGVVCGSLGKDVGAPQLNQTVVFTCTGNFSAVDPVYEFRHRVGSGSYTVVPGTPSTDKTRATAQISINQAGDWQVQCRVCTDASKTSCTTWGQAQ